MAMVGLFSTVSWTIEKHTCMGRIMDVSLFTKAQDCGMKAAMQAMDMDADENHCCDDEKVTLQGQDDLKIAVYDFSLEQQGFVVALLKSYNILFVKLMPKRIANEYYPPPLLFKDIQLLNEIFLI